MNIINRVVALSCISLIFSSFTMEEQRKVVSIKSKLLSEIRDGVLIRPDLLVMSGEGGTILCNLEKGEEKKISEERYTNFVKQDKRVAGSSFNSLLIYNVSPDEVHEEPWPLAHVALAFNHDNELFVHNKGHFIAGDYEIEHDGQSLIGIDLSKDYKKNTYKIRCKNKASVPSLVCCLDKIIYPGGDKKLLISYIKDGIITKKRSVDLSAAVAGFISGEMICSNDGTYVAVTGTSEGGSELHVYELKEEEYTYYGNFNGCAFHPNNAVIAILRHNTAIDYWNLETKDRYYTKPIIENQELPGNYSFAIEFSPDGKNIFVVIPQGKLLSQAKYEAFMISVPAIVYAYKKEHYIYSSSEYSSSTSEDNSAKEDNSR